MSVNVVEDTNDMNQKGEGEMFSNQSLYIKQTSEVQI